jgi:hypothetical protein
MKSMHKFQRPLAFLLAICLLLSTWGSVNAQTQDFEFFDETGHNVQGEFLAFYRKAGNPTLLYGYPITEEFIRTDGLRVQYFQRARFEYRPELPEGQRIVLTQIGRELYTPTLPLEFSNPFACRTFEQTGYSVCFAFLEFFDAYGGLAQFGAPVSPFEFQDNMIVQYFENGRVEWQPSREDGQRVIVTDLGRIYFDHMAEDPGLLPPVQPMSAGTQPLVLSLQVHAFVEKAVVLSSDLQTIYLVVQDQSTQPIADSDCTTTVHWPDQHSDSTTTRTNQNGVSIVALSFSNQPQGEVIYVDVACVYNGYVGTTSASFRIWY